jgi:hypothetical protein
MLKTYGILFLIIAGLVISCKSRTYDYTNSNVAPAGVSYSYYNYGSGTNSTAGALIINIHSSSANTYNEYYIVQIFGIGTYTVQPGYNQLSIPNVWANSYNFSIEKICTVGSTSGCTRKTVTDVAIINTETTTVADAWL